MPSTGALIAIPALLLAGLAAPRVEGALVWMLLVAVGPGAWLRVSRPLVAALLFFAASASIVALGFERVSLAGAATAAALLAGLFASAQSLAHFAPRCAFAAAPFLAAAVVLLARAPDLFGSEPAGWAKRDPALAARVLDLSPATWVVESAGLDWMRHPAVYAPAGTDWFSDSRRPVRGALAAALALVVGCLAAVALRRFAANSTDPGHERASR